MPGQVTVSDDLALHIGRARAPLTPSQAFATAEALIRAATRSIVLDAADAAMTRGVLADPAAYLRDTAE
jgi:hypothetical protein